MACHRRTSRDGLQQLLGGAAEGDELDLEAVLGEDARLLGHGGEAVQMALAFQASFSLRGSLAWLAKACRPAALSMIDSAVAALARRRARRCRRLLLRGAGRAEGFRPVP